MFPLSTRFILLVSSLAAAYFAFWFGSYIGGLTSWAWSIGNSKDNLWGTFAFILGVVILITFVIGLISSIVAVGIALDIAHSDKSEYEIQGLYVAGAFACLLLCFAYGALATPGAVVWYKDKWNLLLVFALTPSAFGAKQLFFNYIFVRIVNPVSDNVTSLRKSS